MDEISLKLSVDEARLVLEGLGNLSFVRVYGLIAKIQEQAGQQTESVGVQNEVSAAQNPDGPTVE